MLVAYFNYNFAIWKWLFFLQIEVILNYFIRQIVKIDVAKFSFNLRECIRTPVMLKTKENCFCIIKC